jgi:SAM-dependent methyltransferase
LTVIGFLGKGGDRYHLTPDSTAFLDRRSPGYMGSIVRFLNSRELMAGFDDLAEVVRRGTSLLSGDAVMEPENPLWVEFARSMAPLVAPAAEFIGELAVRDAGARLRVLDLAAGHGLFGIAVARRHPAAEVVANDWPNVLRVAEENAAAAGVRDRYRLLPGDALEVEFGTDFDRVLIPNLLHHFDPPTCVRLMRKVHAGLALDGLAITVEFVPDEDRVTPPIPATFSLMMLGATAAGDAYTAADYERMFRTAGFRRSELVPVPGSPQRAVVSYR